MKVSQKLRFLIGSFSCVYPLNTYMAEECFIVILKPKTFSSQETIQWNLEILVFQKFLRTLMGLLWQLWALLIIWVQRFARTSHTHSRVMYGHLDAFYMSYVPWNMLSLLITYWDWCIRSFKISMILSQIDTAKICRI